MRNKIILPKARNISMFPTDIMIDTNVFLLINNPSHKYHKDAKELVTMAINKGSALYYNQTIFNELAHKVYQIKLKEIAHQNGINTGEKKYCDQYGYKNLTNDLNAINPALVKEVVDLTKSEIETVISIAEFLPESNCLNYPEIMHHLMGSYSGNLETNDLSVLVTGYSYGINSIATGDYGYASVPNINIVAIPTFDYKKHVKTNPDCESTTTFDFDSFKTSIDIK